MSFIWPAMLVLLLAVPLCVALYLRSQRRRAQLAASYGSFGLLQAAGGRRLGRRRHIPPALFLASLTIMIVALARPETVVSLPRVEGTVILAFDVSGSMAAEDMQPTRMEAAKAVAREFVQRQPSTVQVGVVAFSDSGFAIQAPTNDQAAILGAINRITPQRGTSLGQGILASLNAIAVRSGGQARRLYSTLPPSEERQAIDTPAVIVLLTDGENNAAPDPLAVAQAAAERGVRIHTVGIGSATGTTLEVNGFTVYTQLDEAGLRQIAELTEGAYHNAESQEDLRAIYENLELQFVVKPEETEVTALVAGLGVLALLAGGICSMLWFGRVP